ncbi:MULTISPECIES: hypothetical protein [Streptomyces]|uniref:Uncharacterized protein n=1 Tax=Streptomyces albus (strain ATCC 21838 / DSM 41398 / FERM P-419 / JCM 4703 / NBRC 107858) TaxID=1081613 RepID=A0A0B5F2R4_STRA4|nr:hypothetical protein [Streptomyces sp. SCSIO ZS0520]AJE85191.1 hypothetical protein SLNWT_4815 [Streptomyces albus]AOU79498.1 hypothetical protein SLNHY_4807 [Streptomyces albus]AYN35222.1 hypothetical protein DUI70_4724 [Streptomyces albus]
MSIAHDHYPELHRLIDQLRPDQAEAVRSVVLHLVVDNTGITENAAEEPPARRRRLSFAGSLEAEPDLATRSSEILREGLGGTGR